MLGDECRQPQAFIQLAHQKETGVGGDARPLECDLQKAIERELKRLVLSFTHRVSPSVAGFLASEPRKSRRGDWSADTVPQPNRKSGTRALRKTL